jgi:hypothetical protein
LKPGAEEARRGGGDGGKGQATHGDEACKGHSCGRKGGRERRRKGKISPSVEHCTRV